ncbi:O160 family O-antigen polymerase [Escherichia coli]|nr:O160 family O-antigen polymerase [Escherichia coli]
MIIENNKVSSHSYLWVLFQSFIFYYKFMLQSWDGDEQIVNVISIILTLLLLCGTISAFIISNIKEKCIFLIIFIFVALNIIIADNKSVFWMVTAFTFLILFSTLTIKNRIRILVFSFIIAWCFFLPLQIFFSNSYTYIDDRYLRYTFGFLNPNGLGMFLLLLQTLLYYWIWTSIKATIIVKQMITIILGGSIICIIFISESRTYILLSFLLLILTVIYGFKKFKFSSRLLFIYLLFVMLLQWLSVKGFENYLIFQDMNAYMSGRVWFSYNLLSQMGEPKFFIGSDISLYQPIDFFFISLLYNNGILASLILLYCNYIFLKKLDNSTKYESILAFIFITVSFTEAVYNIPLLNFFFLLLYKKELRFS